MSSPQVLKLTIPTTTGRSGMNVDLNVNNTSYAENF